MAACGSPSSWNGGFPVAISMIVHPRDQMSAGAPYPRGPLSMISGAMYCSVPADRGEDGNLEQWFLTGKEDVRLFRSESQHISV